MRYVSAILLCTALGAFMGRLDTNIVAVALPAIAENFHITAGATSNLMLYYLLAISVLLIPMGALGDRIGFRTLLVAGYFIFTLGSLLCGLSGSLGQLTLFRVMQGSGAAMMIVSAYSLVPRRLPLSRVGRAMGLMATAGSVGVLVGAPLGGVLTQHFSWRSIFLINIPVGVVTMLIAWRGIPRDAPEELRRIPFDVPGCILACAWILLLTIGVDRLSDGAHLSEPILLLGSSLVLMVAFIYRQRHAEHPLLDRTVFGDPRYLRALLVQGLMFMVAAGNSFSQPFFLDRVMGLSPQETGLALALFPIGVSLAAPFAGRLADRVSSQFVIMGGALGVAISTAAFTASLTLDAGWFVYLYFPLMGMSFGSFLSPSAKLLLAELQHGSQGTATSVFHTINNLFLSLGVACSALAFSWAAQSAQASTEPIRQFLPLFMLLTIVSVAAVFLTALNLRGGAPHSSTAEDS